MRLPVWQADLIAGVIAAACLLALVRGGGLAPLLGVAVGLLVYLGVRTALVALRSAGSKGQPDAALDPDTALDECRTRLRQMRQFGQSPMVARRSTAAQIQRIQALADRVLKLLEERPDRRVAAYPFLAGYLVPILTYLEQYTRLAGHEVATAEHALDEAEQRTLPTIETALQRFHEDLLRDDVTDLAAASTRLAFLFDQV